MIRSKQMIEEVNVQVRVRESIPLKYTNEWDWNHCSKWVL